MRVMTYTAARKKLASTMDRVCADHVPIVITRNKNQADEDQAVVLLALEDYEAMEETMHLLRSPANVQRLFESIRDVEQGKGILKVSGELFKE